ncbi:MAG: phosphate regulon sensor histidine kinase PhoR [Aromatoleum sp.]|nr:phosphate regulon sensor histidine kinase PhoR [Aromatoleum sp.]
MSPVFLAGLVAPVAVAALTALVGMAFGAGWALAVLAPGAAGIVIYHLWNLHLLARWTRASSDTAVPEGRGAWRIAFSDLYRRVRLRTAYQRDLAHTIERFTSAAEALPDGMVVLDAANRIRWANAHAQRLMGLDLARDVGQALGNLVRQPEFIRYLDTGDFIDAVVVDSHRDAGATLSIQIVPFGVEEKLLISRDITRLEAVTRMRRDFIANVSHELKTPLTVVSGFLETLQDLDLEPRQRTRFLRLMQEQAKNMQRLVDDLLTLSALESEQNALTETTFAVMPLMLELSAEAKALSGGQHTISLDVGPDGDAGATVVGARDELASAFGNLVSNAIRYTPAGGTITLGWHVGEDGSGRFSVADTGIGISVEHIPRLTERFYRIDRSRSRATGGTGLGLAIVKHVLLRHQAELDVASDPGAGSTFSVVLPAARVRRVAAANATAATVAPTSS